MCACMYVCMYVYVCSYVVYLQKLTDHKAAFGKKNLKNLKIASTGKRFPLDMLSTEESCKEDEKVLKVKGYKCTI